MRVDQAIRSEVTQPCDSKRLTVNLTEPSKWGVTKIGTDMSHIRHREVWRPQTQKRQISN